MASPSIRSKSSYESTSSGTSHSVPYPATISAGDTLIYLATHWDDNGSVSITDWTAITPANEQDISTRFSMNVFYKKADGDETGNFTVTITNTEAVIATVFAIQGAADPDTTPPEAEFIEQLNTTTPDPASITPTGGSKDYLFLTSTGAHNGSNTATEPSGYALEYDLENTVTQIHSYAVASKQSTASAEDPGTWTWTVNSDCGCHTVAVHPGAGGPSITSVSGDDAYTDGDTGIAVVGTGFV